MEIIQKITLLCIFVLIWHGQSIKCHHIEMVYEILHEEITQIQNDAHEKSFNINTDLLNKLNSVYLTLLHDREEALQEIEKQTTHILYQLQLNANDERIQICVKHKNSSSDQLIYEAIGGSTVCRNLIDSQRLRENGYIDELYSRQHHEHLELEKVKKYCNSSQKTERELENCIIGNIINVRIPSIQTLKEQSKLILKKFKDTLDPLHDEYESCMSIIEKDIIEQTKDNIIYIFEQCCKNSIKTSNP